MIRFEPALIKKELISLNADLNIYPTSSPAEVSDKLVDYVTKMGGVASSISGKVYIDHYGSISKLSEAAINTIINEYGI